MRLSAEGYSYAIRRSVGYKAEKILIMLKNIKYLMVLMDQT